MLALALPFGIMVTMLGVYGCLDTAKQFRAGNTEAFDVHFAAALVCVLSGVALAVTGFVNGLVDV